MLKLSLTSRRPQQDNIEVIGAESENIQAMSKKYVTSKSPALLQPWVESNLHPKVKLQIHKAIVSTPQNRNQHPRTHRKL